MKTDIPNLQRHNYEVDAVGMWINVSPIYITWEQIEEVLTQGRLLVKALELDWPKAKTHFDSIRQQYQDLEGTPGVNMTLALRCVFDQLAARYNGGERTPELHREMLQVE